MRINSIITRSIAIMVVIIIVGCSCNKTQNNAHNTEPNNEQKASNVKETMDSTNLLEEQVNEFSMRLKKVEGVENEIATLKENLTTEKRNNIWYFIIIFSFIVLCLITAMILMLKTNERLTRHRKEIEQLKGDISNINFRPQQQVRPSSNHVSRSDFNTLATRITKIENVVMNNTINVNSRESNRITNIHKDEPKEISKTGYFGPAVSGEGGTGYFKKLLDSIEDARFRVAIIDNTATYEPIVHLNAIKSSDAMDLAIEFEGVSKNEATAMSIKHKGKATKVGDKWIIISKAVVTLN